MRIINVFAVPTGESIAEYVFSFEEKSYEPETIPEYASRVVKRVGQLRRIKYGKIAFLVLNVTDGVRQELRMSSLRTEKGIVGSILVDPV